MSYADIKPISDAFRKCSTPSNFLIFGLTHETLLWKALNNNGRTVFIDENRYFTAYTWRRNTTKSKELKELVAVAKEQIRNECRPVQKKNFIVPPSPTKIS
ncbi:unnamed protein product [Prunus brigantina]